MSVEIANFEDLLGERLEPNKKIVQYTTKSLIGPGENYGSIMLAVAVKLKNTDNDSEEDLHLVAKLCPPTAFIKQMFNIPVTFKKEVAFYNEMLPTLVDFQIKNGSERTLLDLFPKYYGSRINVDKCSDEVSDDACLVLENIKVLGYDIGDRMTGFGVEVAEFIIKDLARFHAVPIALKLADPELFEDKIRKHLINHYPNDPDSRKMYGDLKLGLLKTISEDKECVPFVNRISKAIDRNMNNFFEHSMSYEEPWATIAHMDYWVNNTMLKFDESGKPIANAMLDFQLIVYGNPMHDLMFFIYSSIQPKLIKEHYARFIDIYYNTFIDTLESLNAPTIDFTFESMQNQLKRAARDWEFFHLLFMLKPIFTDRSEVKELGDINENEMISTDGVADVYYSNLNFVIFDFMTHNWI